MNQTDPSEENDHGFLFSLNLMVLGGVLLLFVIITLNKILTHYFSNVLDQNRGILYTINVMESDTFRISGPQELLMTWLALLLSLAGLILVIVKLVKTWSY